MALPTHPQAFPPRQALGSLSCNNGELYVYIYSETGYTHLFCAQVDRQYRIDCPNAWVKYYDFPERVVKCSKISLHIAFDYINLSWGEGIVSLTGALSDSSQTDFCFNGRGHWSGVGGNGAE